MKTTRYAIHGIIDILVDPHVNDAVIEQIDFQIGYFKTTGDQLSAPHHMGGGRYGKAVVGPALTFGSHQLSRSIIGTSRDDQGKLIHC